MVMYRSVHLSNTEDTNKNSQLRSWINHIIPILSREVNNSSLPINKLCELIIIFTTSFWNIILTFTVFFFFFKRKAKEGMVFLFFKLSLKFQSPNAHLNLTSPLFSPNRFAFLYWHHIVELPLFSIDYISSGILIFIATLPCYVAPPLLSPW